MATGARVCQEMGFTQADLDYDFCEYCSIEHYGDTNPIPNLEVNKKSRE